MDAVSDEEKAAAAMEKSSRLRKLTEDIYTAEDLIRIAESEMEGALIRSSAVHLLSAIHRNFHVLLRHAWSHHGRF